MTLPHCVIRLLAGTAVLASAGCHTMHFELRDEPNADVVYERKHFYFWGLTPTIEVDMRKHCPNGVIAVREETTFVDGLCELPTLGIWSPRSSWYYCRPAPEEGAKP